MLTPLIWLSQLLWISLDNFQVVWSLRYYIYHGPMNR